MKKDCEFNTNATNESKKDISCDGISSPTTVLCDPDQILLQNTSSKEMITTNSETLLTSPLSIQSSSKEHQNKNLADIKRTLFEESKYPLVLVRWKSRLFSLLKFLFIILLLSLWLGYLFTISTIYFLDTYAIPIINQTGQHFVLEEREYEWNNRNGNTYYRRYCYEDDVTSTSQDDITWFPQRDFTDMLMFHGAGIIPSLLSKETSTELRKVILQMNQNTPSAKQFSLKEHGQRWSLRLNPYDLTLDPDRLIQKALKELYYNSVLKNTLEQLLGPDPAMVELAAITSAPGALEQSFHCDTWYDGSHLGHPRSHTALYSIFIYLQETHVDMGMTGLCLGTHLCSGIENVECIFPSVQQGDAVVLNSQTYHQGAGNTAFQRKDGTRVMFIVTFSSRPRVGSDPRFLPMGSVYGMPSYLWGHTFSDFLVMQDYSWSSSLLQALGIKRIGKNWGISYLIGAIVARAENANAEEEDEWFLERDYWVQQSNTFKKYGLYAIVASSFFLLSFAASTNVTQVSVFIMSFSPFIKCTFLSVGFIAVFFFIFSKCHFGHSVIRGERFYPVHIFQPLTEANFASNYTSTVSSPSAIDILFGDNLDAYYTFQNTFYYDYHPGNSWYLETLEEQLEEWESTPEILKNHFIQTQVLKHLELSSRRFLRQNEYGHWATMNKEQVFNEIHHDFHFLLYPVTRVLWKETNFILSQCKFGDGARPNGAFADTNTTLSKVHLPSFIQQLQKKLITVIVPKEKNKLSLKSAYGLKSILKKPTVLSGSSSPSIAHTNLVPTPKNSDDYLGYLIELIEVNDDSAISEQKVLQNSRKYGALQNVTFGGLESVIDMIKYMENLPTYMDLDKEQIDRKEFDEMLRVYRECRNTNEFCSYWASFGFCTKEEYQEYLSKECMPSCKLCHLEE